jgi:hypothetical protein
MFSFLRRETKYPGCKAAPSKPRWGGKAFGQGFGFWQTLLFELFKVTTTMNRMVVLQDFQMANHRGAAEAAVGSANTRFLLGREVRVDELEGPFSVDR